MASKSEVLVLLDRDGVLCDNRMSGVMSLSQFKLVPDLLSSMKKLNHENFKIAVVTNQPDIARGLVSLSEVEKMHEVLRKLFIEAGIKEENFAIFICPHASEDGCDCRKPKTGMIKDAVKKFNLDPSKTRMFMVGDKITDMQTLENYYNEVLSKLGVKRTAITTILLNWKYEEPSAKRKLLSIGDVRIMPDIQATNFDEVATLISNQSKD